MHLALRALLALGLAACSGLPLQAEKARWRLAETEHFALYTDLSAERAADTVRELERLLAAFAQHGFQLQGALPLHVRVVMFQRRRDFADYFGYEVGGYLAHQLLFEPWMVLPAPRGADDLTIVRHELAHFVAYQGMQSQPRWLAEGIATYFESAHFDERGRFVIGGVPLNYWNVLAQNGRIDAAPLFTGKDYPSQQFYASAWLTVHYLMTERGEPFERYQRLIGRGHSHRGAWEESFPQFGPAQLDEALSAYLRTGEFAKFVRPVHAPEIVPDSDVISRADRLALDAVLQLTCPRCGESERVRAAQSLTLAREADPTHLQAVALASLEFAPAPKEALEPLRTLTKRHPRRWLAWLAYGITLAKLGRLAEVDPLHDPVAHALKLAPRQPYVHMLAALQHAARGERDAASAVAARAHRMAPTDLQLLTLEAGLLANLAECAALKSLVGKIGEIGHEQLSGQTREQLALLASSCSGIER
jgi:hypothetical protein